jgi:serine protease Do
MRSVRVRLAGLAVMAGALLGAAPVEAQPGPPDPRGVRRTPVVEVFQQWSESVVCVTGPTIQEDRPTLEEFFALPAMKPLESRIGSGFVIHESGYVMTNAHAADRIVSHQVVLSDGKNCPAELVASRPDLDLAVLKVEAGRPLRPVRLAGSGDVMIGETVVVIANPHGLMRTCTAGVVSALGRASHLADLPGVTLRDLIQSDAGINPGSSGGPWFNVVGEVVGLTASMRRDSENIGFAISAATLRNALPPMLDVEARYGIATGLSLPDDGPCQVAAVEPDSPAAKAGVLAADVIQELAGRPTPTAADFHLALLGRKPEETVPVVLARQGQPVQANLTLGRRPKPDGAALLKQKLGLTAAPLDPQKAKAMSMRVPRGVVITEVEPGLFQMVEHKPEPGDVLARLGKLRPRDLDHVGLLLERTPAGRPLPVVLLRVRGQTVTRIDLRMLAR